jgi:hypothetical protein
MMRISSNAAGLAFRGIFAFRSDVTSQYGEKHSTIVAMLGHNY